jgi:GR25 family glycosyltransferase involved in LPS biosynthesis
MNNSNNELHETDLKDANLNETDLKDANLNETDLKDANLNETDLKDTNLNETDLNDANIIDFNNTNFSFLYTMKFCKTVINLKRRSDRLKEFIEKCPFKNVNILYAFDGSNLFNESDKFKANQFLNLNNGEIGCFISHIRCYEYMIKNNIDNMLIFEDDCNFCDNFINNLNNILIEYNNYKVNNKTFDILYIGGRFGPNFFTNANISLKISENLVKHIDNNLNNTDRFNLDRTTHSYIISKYTAGFLLDIFYNSIIDKPIDHWLIKTFNKYNYSIYSSQPLICYSPLVGNSDIR